MIDGRPLYEWVGEKVAEWELTAWVIHTAM